jgi:hypothetical protein
MPQAAVAFHNHAHAASRFSPSRSALAERGRQTGWRRFEVPDGKHSLAHVALQPRPTQTGKFYRPRDHEASPFFKIVRNRFDDFERVYPERYQRRYGYWRPVIRSSIDKFLKCGDLKEGFARVKCNSVRIEAEDHAGMQRLVEYISRCPFSLARMVTPTENGKIVYRASKGKCFPFPKTGEPVAPERCVAPMQTLMAGIPRNFEVFDPLDFLAEVTQHIPC